MIAVYALFFIPLIIFVLAFLYETFLSFRRLQNIKVGKQGYVHATWEVTHTLLVFALVVLIMMFTKSIDALSSTIFVTTFLAAVALIIRSICYTYIFYVRKSQKTSWVDWLFAVSHVAAALFLVITVIKIVWFLVKQSPEANLQFVPMFIPGLILVLVICALPMFYLYSTKE